MSFKKVKKKKTMFFAHIIFKNIIKLAQNSDEIVTKILSLMYFIIGVLRLYHFKMLLFVNIFLKKYRFIQQ